MGGRASPRKRSVAQPERRSPRAHLGGGRTAPTGARNRLSALAESLLIASLTTSFIQGIQENLAVPESVGARAETELGAGIPFVSDADLQAALDDAGVPPQSALVAIEENESARLLALRSSLAVLALAAVIALFFTGRIPSAAPGVRADAGPAATAREG
jgi:hypothetical protein